MKHVVMFSGGIGSWAAAKRVAERHGTDNLTLLFSDTLIEDEDNYRFITEAAANVGGEFVRIADGRDPWQVFRDERFLENSRVDPCSRVLKREIADHWLAEHCDPAETVVYTGIDWSEEHRHARLRDRRAQAGWRYEAPMCEPPYLTKAMMLDWLRAEGIQPPRMYAMGFSHANCGGFCIKAGQGHYATLLRQMPERYACHEAQEQAMREYLGRDDIAILRDHRDNGRPMTLRELRERLQSGGTCDLFDIGGCGCFSGEGQEAGDAS
jgi:hypothetical protein